MFVRPSTSISSASIGYIFVKFDIGDFYENLCKMSKRVYNRTKISSTLLEDVSTFHCFMGHHIIIWGLLSVVWRNNAKWTHCCVPISTFSLLITLLTLLLLYVKIQFISYRKHPLHTIFSYSILCQVRNESLYATTVQDPTTFIFKQRREISI